MSTIQEQRHFEKRVTIVEKDDDEWTATGAALVPDAVDHQHDFLRTDGIAALFNDDPADGVMHAVFPSGSADLVRNETIDEPESIGGQQFPAGTWIITRQYHDDQLYQLVSDGVLSGFSIGGTVSEVVEYDGDEIPADVTIPDGVDIDGESVTQIIDGEVSEISDVDFPAVPNAQYATVKSHALGKSVLDEVDGESDFVELMAERGHTESDAMRLWDFLQSHKAKPIGKPFAGFDDFDDCLSTMQEQGHDEEVARRICGQLQEEHENDMTDSEIPDKSEEEETKQQDIEAVDDETLGKRVKRFFFGTEADDGGEPEDSDAEKAGRTLSGSNRQNVMAIHDVALSMLNASGAETGTRRRFTDDRNSSFDISEYGKAAPTDSTEATDENAPDGDTSDDTMTDDTDKSLAEENAGRLDTIEEKLDKALGEGSEEEETEKTMDDAPEWAQSLSEKVEANTDAIEAIGKQSGTSTQLGGVESDEEEESTMDAKTKLFAPAAMQGVK